MKTKEPKGFKGTPGIWQTFEISEICMGVEATDTEGQFGYGQVLCNPILPDTDEQYDIEKEEILSNMQLMACSKELIVCLQEMLYLFDRGLSEGTTGRIYCDGAKDLIKKALTI